MKSLKIRSRSEINSDLGLTGLEEPLSPSAVLYVRTHAAHILVAIGFKSPTNIDTFRAQVPSVLNHPRFSSLLVEDVEKKKDLKWVQISQLNINDHIIAPKIIANNPLAGDKVVEDYLHNLTKTSLDTSKPLWEIHLLNVQTSEAESICIFRIHHALGDGISITSHIVAWTRQASNPDALPTIAGMRKRTKTKTKTKRDKYMWWKCFISFMLMALWWVKAIWNTTVDVLRSLSTLFIKDTDLLVMASMKTGSKERRIAYKTFDLGDIKFIKNAMGVTINDVALGVIEAGFSRTLNRRFGNGILDKVMLRIAMPVSLRPIEGLEGLNDIKKKDTKLGLANRIGFVTIPLSTRLRDDPLEYIRKAKVAVDRKKHSFEAKVNIDLCKFFVKFSRSKVADHLTSRIFSHLSIIISNMPGPVEEISFYGHPIKFIAPTVYGLPTPIMISLQSCTNEMAVVVAVREDVVIDPHEIIDDIKESLLQIKGVLEN